MRASRKSVTAAILAGATLTLMSCGVPQDGQVRVVGTENVPNPPTSSIATSTPTNRPSKLQAVSAEIGFIQDDHLVVRQRRIPATTSVGQVQALLDELQRGPSSLERAEGLESAVTSVTRLTVTGLRATVVTVDISAQTPDQSSDRLPLIIGQLVFTVTSVRGVGALQLERDGTAVDAPLPGGSLTSAPVTRADFQNLTTAEPTAPDTGSPATP